MRIIWNDELYHYGVPRRSGRYKWGSGANPYHHGSDGSRRSIKKAYKKERKEIWKQSKQLLKDNKAEYKHDLKSNRENVKKDLKENREDYKSSKKVYKNAYKDAKTWMSPGEAEMNYSIWKDDGKERYADKRNNIQKENSSRKSEIKEQYKSGEADIRKNTGIAQYKAKKAYRKAVATRVKDIKGVDTRAYKRAVKKYNAPAETFLNFKKGRWVASRFMPLGFMTNTHELYRVKKQNNKYSVGYTRGATIGPLAGVPTKHKRYGNVNKRKK